METVTTNLSLAFISSVMSNRPEAVQVFDQFHLVCCRIMHKVIYNESYIVRKLLKKQVTKDIRWLQFVNNGHIDKMGI